MVKWSSFAAFDSYAKRLDAQLREHGMAGSAAEERGALSIRLTGLSAEEVGRIQELLIMGLTPHPVDPNDRAIGMLLANLADVQNMVGYKPEKHSAF